MPQRLRLHRGFLDGTSCKSLDWNRHLTLVYGTRLWKLDQNLGCELERSLGWNQIFRKNLKNSAHISDFCYKECKFKL